MNYTERFQISSGKSIYVQNELYRKAGMDLIKWGLKRWKPPLYYFHYKKGGHVAALKHHLDSYFFARGDFEGFFGHVTRNKIVRALKRIGFCYEDAYDFAVASTVSDINRYFLPFGFVQSPYLATLCLDKSKVGDVFKQLISEGIKLSIYVDDFMLSGCDETSVDMALSRITLAAEESGFPLNSSKVQNVGAEITAFNIKAGKATMSITSSRLREFEDAVLEAGDGPKAQAIIAYVDSVNQEQASELRLKLSSSTSSL